MAEIIPITNMSPGLHCDVDPRLVPAGACVRGQNTRHHLGTIRVREGRVVQLPLPEGTKAAAKLLVEYRTQTDPISRLLLVAGDALYGTPTADADSWYQVEGDDAPLLEDTDLFHGSAAVQSSGYKDYQYFVDSLNNVLKWKWGDTFPVRLTDLPKPTYAPDIAIVNTPLSLLPTLAGQTWSKRTGYMAPITGPPTDPFYSVSPEPFGYGTSGGDNDAELVRAFTTDQDGNPWPDSATFNGFELVTTTGLWDGFGGLFNAKGWMEIEYPRHRGSGNCLDLSNSDTIHLQFQLAGASESPSHTACHNPFPEISLQLGNYVLGDLAHSMVVSYSPVWDGTIDAYVSLAGISKTDLSSVQFIAIKVDATKGGAPRARFDTAGYASDPGGNVQNFATHTLALTFILKKLEANALTSNFVAGATYNVYTTFLFEDPHDSTNMLESDVSPVSSVALLSDSYLNPSGLSVAQEILPTITIPPDRDLTALEYNGALPDSINIYANGGEWGAIVKLVGNIPITDSDSWATQPLEIVETLATDLDGVSVRTTPGGLIGPAVTPYQAAPPKGASLITEWRGRMVYGAMDGLYVSAWDNPDLIAPVAISDALGTTYGFSDTVGMDGFPLTGFGGLGSYLVIFKNRGKWLLSGSDASTFDLMPLPGNEGCSSPKSVASVAGGNLIWRDGKHVWMMGGDFIPHDIGIPINTLLDKQPGQSQEDYDVSVLHTFCCYDPVGLMYVMVVPSSTTGNNQATAYAFELRDGAHGWDTPFTGYPGGCAAQMELLTTKGIYAADTGLTGNVTRLGEGLTDEGNPIYWQWVSSAITGPISDRQKDVRQLTALCSFDDPVPPATTSYLNMRLHANGRVVSYATKTVELPGALDTNGLAKWSPPPCSNLNAMQAGFSGSTSIGGEIVQFAFFAEVKGMW